MSPRRPTRVATLPLVPVGAAAGLVGAFVMALPMGRRPEGWTPAFVAAAVLARSAPDRVDRRIALAVHYGAGVGAGLSYGLLAGALAGVGGPVLAGLPLAGHLLAVGAVVAGIYGLFAFVVLPRAGPSIPGERATAVRGGWLRSALVFGAVLAVAVPGLAFALADAA